MRIFVKQTNLIETSPLIVDGEPITTATVTAKILEADGDELVSVTLDHLSGGIYSKVMSEIAELVDNTTYFLEVSVVYETRRVFYLKQPITAIIRSNQPL